MTLPLPDRLRTPRLDLSLWASADVDALQEALAESVAHLRKWIPWAGDAAPTRSQASALIERWVLERRRGENVIWAMRERAGRLVGGIGVYDRVGPEGWEIGYWVRATAVGRGLCTEAAEAVVDAAFAVPGIQRLELHMDPANGPSRRVAGKLGFRLRESTGFQDDGGASETVVFARERAGEVT